MQADGPRANAIQYARRLNAAVELLGAGLDVAQATRQLARRYRLSERQARRYVERAQVQGRVTIPGPKRAFTVKLPGELLGRLRSYARTSRQTLSALVTQAVEEFLDRQRVGRGGGG